MHVAESGGSDARKARAAVRAGALAYFVDQFDIYLPIVTLAPATAYFQSENLDPGTTAILDALVFASTLIARPIGAAVFGHFADRTGRKKTTLVAVAGFGITTLLIALLPGYESIGLWSIGTLIALRFIDGFFLGGEYTTAVPLAMEWSPKRQRGRNSGFITATSPGAYSVIALITLGLLALLPSAGVHSAYAQWGWRIPFVIGALLALVLFLAYRRNVTESHSREAVTDSTPPLVALLRSRHRRGFAQIFVLMTGVWLANNMANAVMPGLLKSHLRLTSSQVTVTMVLATLAAALSYPVLGHLSQLVGRRRFYLGIGLVMGVGGTAAYALLMTEGKPLASVIGLAVLVEVIGIGTFGPIAAYLTERFPTEIRASGYGVGYSLALILPAFYPFYLQGLGAGMPSFYAPAVLMALAGLLVAIGAAIGPETKDNDMIRTAGLPENRDRTTSLRAT